MRAINYRVCGVYSTEPRGDVYCFKLNFKISKLAYYRITEYLCYNEQLNQQGYYLLIQACNECELLSHHGKMF